MIIGIDARLLEQKMTGIGRVVAEILSRVSKMDHSNQYVLFCYQDLPSYRNLGLKVVVTGKPPRIPEKIFSFLWLNFILPRRIKEEKIDKFFFPSSILPVLKLGCKKIVLLCDVFHKVKSEFQPLLYRIYLDLFLSRSINKSDLVITISQYSKKDIIKFYNTPESKIEVMLLSASEKFQPREVPSDKKEDLVRRCKTKGKIILYVGVIDIRKNIQAIINAADKLINEEKRDITFILIGKPYTGYQKIISASKIIPSERFLFLNHVSEEDLMMFYNIADIFIFPSFYEGFGLPPLEAMKSGLPTVVSNSSSLPEVIGNGALSVDPQDSQGFARAIASLLDDQNLYDKTRQEGLKQAQKFSWDKTVQEFINLINKKI